MVATYRRSVIAGPLICADLVAGQPGLSGEEMQRLGLDALLVVGLGLGVFAAKQGHVHRRTPLV